MKKIAYTISFILIIAIVIYFINRYFNMTTITEDEAKKIATLDVDNRYDIYNFNSIKLKDNVYTLDFTDNYNKYIYKINANNKKIISSKKTPLNSDKTYIDSNEILNIVFNDAKISKDECEIIANDISKEKAITVYNTVFFHNNIKYNYKTDAYTGTIISVSKINLEN